jgi:hypothetical protein
VLDVELVTLENHPAAQEVQVLDRSDSAYFPASHAVQIDAPPEAYFPAAHVMQSLTLALREPAAEAPAGHGEQATVPSE